MLAIIMSPPATWKGVAPPASTTSLRRDDAAAAEATAEG
jgi:hypothetical protein